MKINLPKHNIEAVTQMDPMDIPIGYIDATDASYDVNFELAKEFSQDTQTPVSAYDLFYDNEIFLFNKDKTLLKDLRFKRQGNAFYYEPNNSKEFQPIRFSCAALIKRRMTYSSGNHYNLRIGVAENDEEFSLSSNLIAAFGDANKRGICPGNITVNNGDRTIQSLLGGISDADFLFISSPDGEDLLGLDVSAALDKHINLWISADSLESFVSADSNLEAKEEGQLCQFYKKTQRKKLPARIFDTTQTLPAYPKEEYEYIYPYEDVLILHRKNKGYIVITPKEFIESTSENAKIIYDILMYIFLNAYKSSKTEESWITNKPVDYMAYNYNQLRIYHKALNLSDMLASTDYDLNDEYDILQINSSRDDVRLVKMAPNKDLFFRKTSAAPADPIKEEGYVSFLTVKESVLLYQSEDIYKVTTRARLSSQQYNGKTFVTVQPLYDSEKHIYFPEAKTIEIQDFKKQCICITSCIIDGTSEISIINRDQYSFDKHGYIVAALQIKTVEQPRIIDTRVNGGGLPIKEKPIYDLIDIGNIYGRPYRIGSTLIIRLPKRLKEYETIIEEAVKSHIAAGEYPVIIYE